MTSCFCTGACRNGGKCPAHGYDIFKEIPGLKPVDPNLLPKMPTPEPPRGGFIPPYEPMASGWQCPRCKSVYGPTAHECYRCNGGNKFTCLTTA